MTASRPFATMVWEGHGASGADIVDRATKVTVGYVMKVRPGKWEACVGTRFAWETTVGFARLRREAAWLVWDNRTRSTVDTVSL